MKKVYWHGPGALYYMSKVHKDYKVGDTLKLKWCICKLRVEAVFDKELYVKPAVMS
jgi:hypothetical protein